MPRRTDCYRTHTYNGSNSQASFQNKQCNPPPVSRLTCRHKQRKFGVNMCVDVISVGANAAIGLCVGVSDSCRCRCGVGVGVGVGVSVSVAAGVNVSL